MDFCQDAIHIAKALLECCSFLTLQLSFISHLWKLFCSFICSIALENQSKVSLLDGDLWGRGEGGFPRHTETLSKRTSELHIFFYSPDNFISLLPPQPPPPPHTGMDINTLRNFGISIYFQEKMIFKSLPLIF